MFDAIRYMFTEQGQRLAEIDNLCCLIHSESYLLQNNISSNENDRERERERERGQKKGE